jgi:hypothetical protein
MEHVDVNTNNRKNVKLLSAVIGGSAVVALGGLTMAFGQIPVGAPVVAKSTTMTIGSTATTTTPPTAPAIPMAVPTIKGPAPLPSEEKAAE